MANVCLPKECYHRIDIEERRIAWIVVFVSEQQEVSRGQFRSGARHVYCSSHRRWEISLLPSPTNLLRNSKSSMVIVVCLLKSLMEDQVASLVPRR